MHDLTGFQRDILWAISLLDDPKGLQIKRELEKRMGYAEVRHGRLYPNLDTLAKKDLIYKGKKDNRTNEYTVTPRGQREITNWQEHWNQA